MFVDLKASFEGSFQVNANRVFAHYIEFLAYCVKKAQWTFKFTFTCSRVVLNSATSPLFFFKIYLQSEYSSYFQITMQVADFLIVEKMLLELWENQVRTY